MSFLGGIGFNPLSVMSLAALGPVGGFMPLIQQAQSSIANQFIGDLGRMMGLPPSAINFAQSVFDASHGNLAGAQKNMRESITDLGNEFRSSQNEIKDAIKTAEDGIRDILNDIAKSDDVKEAGKGKGKYGGQGWLRAMAEVLGKKLDDLSHEMEDLANRVTKDDPSTSTDFTVVSQQFNMLMNTVSTALKTIGEALGHMASKQ